MVRDGFAFLHFRLRPKRSQRFGFFIFRLPLALARTDGVEPTPRASLSQYAPLSSSSARRLNRPTIALPVEKPYGPHHKPAHPLQATPPPKIVKEKAKSHDTHVGENDANVAKSRAHHYCLQNTKGI
jgi:hypothetical protein